MLLALVMSASGLSATAGALHDIIYLTRTDFFVSEVSGVGVVELKRCCHGATEATVDATTSDGTATAGQDYSTTSRTIRFSSPVEDADLEVPLIDDSVVENLETIAVSISNPTGNATLGPDKGVITVIDNDGPARMSFSRVATDGYENYGAIEFIVIRSGDAGPETTVAYTTSDGSAQAGSDYTLTSGTITFEAGQRIKRFNVPITNDRLEEGAEDFLVTLSHPAGGEVAEPSTISATILDDETASSDTAAPVSYFHQPLHGETYRPGAIRDILAFADDYGTGVKRVEVALLAKKTNGSCRWFSKKEKRFMRASCRTKVWMRFRTDETVIYTLPQRLRSSRGTKTRFYKAWSRGVDEIGNVETAFEPFRNVSRFEVR